MSLISPETMAEHKATWFVYAGDERIRFQQTMRGTWDFDVVCSCGWDSRIGGGTRTACRRALDDHRSDAQFDKELKAEACAAGVDPADRTAYNLFLADKLLKGI